METTAVLARPGLGVGELSQAAVAEAARIVAEVGSDPIKQCQALIAKLLEFDLIRVEEVDIMTRLVELGEEYAGRDDAGKGYLQTRALYHRLLAAPGASPVALAFASGMAGSYTPSDYGDGKITYRLASAANSWTSRLSLAGGLIGTGLGIIVGSIVDHCEK